MSSTLLRSVKIPDNSRIVGGGTTLLKSVVSVVAEFRRVGLDPIPPLPAAHHQTWKVRYMYTVLTTEVTTKSLT